MEGLGATMRWSEHAANTPAWIVYITGFSTYTFMAVRLESDLLITFGATAIFRASAIFCGIALGFWAWRKIKVRGLATVPFEADMPEDLMFQGFNLSEIHAAQSVAAQGAADRRQ